MKIIARRNRRVDGETLLQLATLIFSFVTGIVTLMVRARLIEQGRDISELKAQVKAQSEGSHEKTVSR